MQKNTALYAGAGIVIALLLLLGAYKGGLFGARTAGEPGENSTTTTTTLPGGEVVTVTGPGTVTINQVDVPSGTPVPDYKKPIAFSSSVSAEARATINANAAQKRAAIQSNPADFNAWVSLGALYHEGGDERAAEQFWLYAAVLAPQASLPYNNLGDLYLNYLKDYVKAESAFKKAIAADAQDVGAYRNLFSLYTEYGYKKGTTAAEDILKKGIAANPKAYDLNVLLARYYAGLGRTADARVQYEAAITAAQAAGQTAIAEQLKAEEAALGK